MKKLNATLCKTRWNKQIQIKKYAMSHTITLGCEILSFLDFTNTFYSVWDWEGNFPRREMSGICLSPSFYLWVYSTSGLFKFVVILHTHKMEQIATCQNTGMPHDNYAINKVFISPIPWHKEELHLGRVSKVESMKYGTPPKVIWTCNTCTQSVLLRQTNTLTFHGSCPSWNQKP